MPALFTLHTFFYSKCSPSLCETWAGYLFLGVAPLWKGQGPCFSKRTKINNTFIRVGQFNNHFMHQFLKTCVSHHALLPLPTFSPITADCDFYAKQLNKFCWIVYTITHADNDIIIRYYYFFQCNMHVGVYILRKVWWNIKFGIKSHAA